MCYDDMEYRSTELFRRNTKVVVEGLNLIITKVEGPSFVS